jgi:hypothetical protein
MDLGGGGGVMVLWAAMDRKPLAKIYEGNNLLFCFSFSSV